MNNLSDMILSFLVHLAQNPTIILPIAVWMVASWRVARLRQMTVENSQERVTESVAETIKEQMSERLKPLFQENNIPLPRGMQVYDVIEKMVEEDLFKIYPKCILA